MSEWRHFAISTSHYYRHLIIFLLPIIATLNIFSLIVSPPRKSTTNKNYSMKRRNRFKRTTKNSRDFCGKEVSGNFPVCGAIFMSNKSTLKECFERSLLGLPESFSGFVRNVKEGMILFLFEFEERKLHGVFRAISDGGIDIVPGAYISSGKQFPAQVKFTTIWHCDPLFENEFCEAIQENYFSTYKFNFGLSKNQVRSLMWLFNARKYEVPHSPHYNKRKGREWDLQSIETKEGFTNTDISEMKLNINHGISVIKEPEMERIYSSPDSCRKCKSIHYDDDAYDPEHPGFHHSVGTTADSPVGHESHEHLTLQQKKGNIHESAEETEVYIPLCSPDDDSDPEQEDIDHFSECFGMSVGNRVSSIPIPQFLVSNEGYNQMKMDHPFPSPHGSSCCRLDDSSSSARLLSNLSDLQPKDAIDDSNSPPPKGLYADKVKKRTSVFSRLNFASKNQNDVTGKELVNDMSRAKPQSQHEYENMVKVTQQKRGIEDCSTMCSRRTSVFMRLTGASNADTSQVHCMTAPEENW